MDSVFATIRSWGFLRGPDRILGGVCGGIAARMGWRTSIVRLVMLIIFLLPGLSWGLYGLVWLFLPWQDRSIPLERLLNAGYSEPPSAQ